ncbi:1-phosphofructokinase [Paenibacillus sp. sptzw28]|uniref:1-phosphofructokinase n=1 Tax=Paenibacillus sp. sptzw28 TaxID=715179 RepID=UPI001C6F5998|nr:1-phosphofructokinase [Paenibacillus sp. sptzw28]QYR21842.1 1-phosphofructokinase [Paenibacillus sp. sptzw28]
MKNRLPVITVTMNPALDKTVTVEQLVHGGLNRIKELRTDAGGKGINVAKVLKHFSLDVAAAGLYAGYQGQILLAKLKSLGIQSLLLEAEGETRTNLKVIDEQTKQTTELNEPGFSADRDILEQFTAQFEAEAANASFVVLGGSLPPGVPPDFYKSLIEIANARGTKTILDADGEAFSHGIEAAPFAVKPNIHELESLFGQTFTSEEEIVSAARTLIDKGIQYVAVSMGAKGSIILGKNEAVRAIPFPITPLSTVGAGDSMVAAMVYCFLHGKTLEDTARWTSAAGTVTASKPGTQVCTLEEVQAKLSAVQISHI